MQRLMSLVTSTEYREDFYVIWESRMNTRRDLVMLGLVHRAAVRKGSSTVERPLFSGAQSHFSAEAQVPPGAGS